MLSESTVYIVPTACACLEARKVQLFGAIEAVGKMSDLPERLLTPATATTLRLSLWILLISGRGSCELARTDTRTFVPNSPP